MKKIILILTTLFCLPIFAQFNFENGYIIKNNGEKFECLIKNKVWLSSPNSIDYKISDESEVFTTNLEEITEFYIYDTDYYYKKFTVPNEKTQINTDYITLFFKVIVLGDASLYQSDVSTFYYSKKNSNLIRLIYEKENKNTLEEDLTFRKELFVNLNTFQKNIDINKLKYTKKDLTKYFIHYNESQKSDYKVTISKRKSLKLKFKVNLFGGYAKTGFDVHNSFYREHSNPPSAGGGITRYYEEVHLKIRNLKNQYIGFETEFFLPIHKHKWALFTSPNYSTLEGTNEQSLPLKNFNYTIKFNKLNSINIPIGLKHYFHINKNIKISIGAFLNYNYLLNNKTFEQIKNVNSNEPYAIPNSLENYSNSQKTFGLIYGITIKEKYNFSMQYDRAKKDINTKYSNVDFKNYVSFILKYSIW